MRTNRANTQREIDLERIRNCFDEGADFRINSAGEVVTEGQEATPGLDSPDVAQTLRKMRRWY